jgi:hypothetical protein
MNNYFKKNLYFVFICLISIIFVGCSSSNNQQINSSFQQINNIVQQIKSIVNDEESKNIEIIKNMVRDDGYRFGDLFENSLSDITYEFYDPAEDGNTYVTIKGNIFYKDKPVVVTLQYKKIDDERYEFYTMTYNDIPQNTLETIAFFNFLEENAIKKAENYVSDDNSNAQIGDDNYNDNNYYDSYMSVYDDEEFILPTADREYIPIEYIESMVDNGDTSLIRLAVNEMFARHGITFQKPENIEYFSSKSWYYPIEGLTDEYVRENLFNEYEKENMNNLLYVEDMYK